MNAAEPSMGPSPLLLYWQTLFSASERLELDPEGSGYRFSFTHTLLTIVIGWVLYNVVVLPFYRLYLSPIAKFPGPRLAAATAWYEFYFDIIQGGQFIAQVEKLHDIYGPIVRINPWELSIRDAGFYPSIYVAGAARRTNMYWRQRANIGINGATVTTEGHDLHRVRRHPLEPFFSRRGVSLLEPLLAEEARLLDHRFDLLRGSESVVELEHVFSAFALDIITRICLENPAVALSQPDFDPTMHTLLRDSLFKISFAVHFPWMLALVDHVPDFLMDMLVPAAAGPRKILEYLRAQIGAEIDRIRAGSELTDAFNPKGSVVRHLLHSDLSAADKATWRMQGELMSLIAGGVSSTSRILTVMSFYLLSDPEMLRRLQDELREPMAGFPERVPTWADLEKMPLLQGCIKEGLRVAPPIARRLPRRSPDEEIVYKEWVIPKNTPVGIQLPCLHMDPDVFPEPEKFKPERWLNADLRMHRNLAPYSRGSRSCLGSNLSNSTMSLALAVLFRPQAPSLSVFETDESDILPVLDYIVMTPKHGHREMKVTVH